jgi:hypothetical protein
MLKFIATSALALAALAALATDAQACGGCRRGSKYAVAPDTGAAATTAQAGQGYRSFSYQPVTPAFRSYSAPRKQPWEYPKTDARRFSNVR